MSACDFEYAAQQCDQYEKRLAGLRAQNRNKDQEARRLHQTLVESTNQKATWKDKLATQRSKITDVEARLFDMSSQLTAANDFMEKERKVMRDADTRIKQSTAAFNKARISFILRFEAQSNLLEALKRGESDEPAPSERAKHGCFIDLFAEPDADKAEPAEGGRPIAEAELVEKDAKVRSLLEEFLQTAVHDAKAAIAVAQARLCKGGEEDAKCTRCQCSTVDLLQETSGQLESHHHALRAELQAPLSLDALAPRAHPVDSPTADAHDPAPESGPGPSAPEPVAVARVDPAPSHP